MFDLRAPRPVLASRSDVGTARNASSEMLAISGVTRKPMATPVTSKLVVCEVLNSGWMRSGPSTRSAKKPNTTLGTPASTSRIGFSHLRVRGEAYSLRNTAAPRPSGAATTIDTNETSTVPMTMVGRSNRPLRGYQPGFAPSSIKAPRPDSSESSTRKCHASLNSV